MVDYTSSTLSGLSSEDFSALATYLSEQTGETLSLRTDLLNWWKDKGTSVWLAKDGATIVGCNLQCPTNNIEFIINHTAFNTYLTNNSISRTDCVVGVDIYIHPDYSGQGIYKQLKANRGRDSIDAGYTYSLSYGFRPLAGSQAVKTIAEGMTGIIDTGCTDLNNNKIQLIPLTSYL